MATWTSWSRTFNMEVESETMKLGLIGLGKMGGGMAWRLTRAGLEVVGTDLNPASRQRAADEGTTVVTGTPELIGRLDTPRVIWVMLPAGSATRTVIGELADLLDPADLVVDGGNSDFRDAVRHAETLNARGIGFADVGVSGGQWGRENGYGLMVGSSPEQYDVLRPVLDALSNGRQHSRVGGTGSGHLVKAVHNGVQYAVMESYAEGYALLSAHPEVDVLAAMQAWQGGSSIRSWLLEQTVAALEENPSLDEVSDRVPDSGMGRWTAEQAIKLGVPTPLLTAALHARFESQSDHRAARLLNATRSRVGGQPS
ncbi:NADP-dependent phosphogluconate dehydrogenase [Sediminivirga luteola]|uniref:NADP-dependent phosphogluconate dehydrogenase n=1 Tax=Sediminivirga luteola TaxID=1774748 RepID=UPI00227A8323|nr:NADP-dependent phosphogluconate dehydrogenase [Sediminivirga luteola]